MFLQKDSKNALLISLDKEKPLVCIIEYQKHLISLENEKYLQLKKLIDDFYLIDICLSSLDNVIAIKIKQAYFPNEEKVEEQSTSTPTTQNTIPKQESSLLSTLQSAVEQKLEKEQEQRKDVMETVIVILIAYL